MKAVLTALGGIILIALVLGCLAMYHAIVLATLWGWFIVPLGAAKIGFAHAYGLSLIGSVVLGVRGLYAPEDKRTEAIVAGLLMPILSLFFGWIALGFM